MQKLREGQVKGKDTVVSGKEYLSKEEKRIPGAPAGISKAVDKGCMRQEH